MECEGEGYADIPMGARGLSGWSVKLITRLEVVPEI